MEHEEYCARAGAEIARLASVTEDAAPHVPVPTCPGWELARLLKHAGIVHRWATAIVAARAAEPVPQNSLDVGPGDAGSGWWARRMLHETAVHRADAELALGIEPEFDPGAAADGIAEFLANATMGGRPSQRLTQLPAGQSIHLHATDEGLGEAGEWLISFGDDGYEWRHGHEKGSVAVRGAAGLLLLLVYGRVRPDDERLQVFGDAGLLATWQQFMTM